MFLKKVLLIIIMWLVSSTLYALESISSTSEGSVRERVKEGIEYAQQSIDMCIHGFAALEIDQYLEVARVRGVRVRVVILEQDNDGVKGLLAEALIDKGFDVRVLKLQTKNDLVQDFIVLDDRILVTGMYNWLAYRNRNAGNEILFYYDPDRIYAYKSSFFRLFAEGEAVPFTGNQKEMVAKNNPPVSGTVSSTADVTQTIQGHALGKTPIAEKESTTPVTETISREFISFSLEELDKQFGKESTLSRSEKSELWKKYKGKYVRWQGVISYKGMGRVDWNHIGVSRQNGKEADVEIVVDWRLFQEVMNLRVGDTIKFTGRLVSRRGYNAPYRLDDGDIE